MTPVAEATPPADARPARSLQARATLAVLALVPGTLVDVMLRGPSASRARAMMVFMALTMVLAQRVRIERVQRSDPFGPLYLVLLALWLPPLDTPTGALAFLVALLVMLMLGLGFSARHGPIPFHPVMVACALALICFPQAPLHYGDPQQPAWIAAAYALGGLALILLRCVRWEAPAGMAAGAGIALAGCWLGFPGSVDASLAAWLPPLALVVFFVADDPPRACMEPRARLLSGGLAGVIGTVAILGLHAMQRDSQGLFALAGTMLLLNAAGPALDRAAASRRARAARA